MLNVKEYASFDKFEQDEHRQDVDLVAIVNKPQGMAGRLQRIGAGGRRAAVPHGSQLDGRPGRSRYRADEPEDVPPVAEARRLLRVHLKGEASSWRTTLLKPFFHRRKHSTSS